MCVNLANKKSIKKNNSGLLQHGGQICTFPSISLGNLYPSLAVTLDLPIAIYIGEDKQNI